MPWERLRMTRRTFSTAETGICDCVSPIAVSQFIKSIAVLSFSVCETASPVQKNEGWCDDLSMKFFGTFFHDLELDQIVRHLVLLHPL